MAYTSVLALLLVFVNVGEGTRDLFYSETPTVIERVATDADLVFRTNFTGQTQYKFVNLVVRVGTITVALGGADNFKSERSDLFGNRLAGTSPLDGRYRLSLRQLIYEDTGIFVGVVFYTDAANPNQFQNTQTSISLEVTGGPDLCFGLIPGTTHINTTGLSRVEIILCGNPKPSVSWMNGSISLPGASEPVPGFKSRYKYYLPMPSVTPSMCGDEIKFVATGLGVSQEGTTKLNVNFDPSASVSWSYRVNASCIRVMWESIDIGTCTGLIYHVEYLNASHSPLSGSNASHPASYHDYCPDDIHAINATRIRVSFSGNVGSWSSGKTVLLTDPFANGPGTGRQTGDTSDNWEWKAILGGVLGGILFILLIILLVYCCCFGICASWCVCCACSDCCVKSEEEGVSNTNSLGFQYKKNSKKKTKSVKSVKVVLDKDTHDGGNTFAPPVVVPVESGPDILYNYPEKTDTLDEMKYFDPNEFEVAAEAPETLKSNYTNSTYDRGEDDDIDNKPSFLI